MAFRLAPETTATGSNCWGLAFDYDVCGNLTNQDVVGSNQCYASGFSVGVDSNNHVNEFTYDASGNVTADSHNTYTWNGKGELKKAASVAYTYDGDGQRVEKSGGKLFWYGQDGELLDETDASGNVTNEYVYFAGKRIAWRDSSGNIHYYAADYLGNSRVIMTSAGVVCYDADFYPYGGERVVTDTCSQSFKFTGKYRDSETGNDYFGARYYTSSFGRFLSPDPDGQDAVNPGYPQTWNMYSYVRNNPLNATDPDGLDCIYTSGQTSKSVDVTIVRGDCLSSKDNGVYVNGTVNANSLTYNGSDLGYSFSNSEDQTGGAGVLSLGQPPSENPSSLLLAVAQGTQMSRPIVKPAFWATIGFLGIFGPGILESSLELPETLGLGTAAAVHPSAPLPTNPAEAPGPGWQWRGSGPPGSSQGSWYNPSTAEKLHPDFQNPAHFGGHWDYTNSAGKEYRVYPNGMSIPKQ